MVWRKRDQILEHTDTLKLCETLVMKPMKKNAREHNINKVLQELTAAGLHIDNEESLKKQNKLIYLVQDFYENKLNKIKNRNGLFHIVDFQHECKVSTSKSMVSGRSVLRGVMCHALPFDSAY